MPRMDRLQSRIEMAESNRAARGLRPVEALRKGGGKGSRRSSTTKRTQGGCAFAQPLSYPFFAPGSSRPLRLRLGALWGLLLLGRQSALVNLCFGRKVSFMNAPAQPGGSSDLALRTSKSPGI